MGLADSNSLALGTGLAWEDGLGGPGLIVIPTDTMVDESATLMISETGVQMVTE